ncbi:MAG: peptidoglycan DD-metalloendopeptidase family protein [Flavobacteriales bacterium]|nr:peptidoglycan DD-metalloendopeptidase family protein [Flavobacteriales bacterium]
MINRFLKYLQQIDTNGLFVIDSSIAKSDYVRIDMSVRNKRLHEVDITSPIETQKYIDEVVSESDGKVAYGGYLEVRDLYKRSKHFKDPNKPFEERNIHLGMDIWIKAGTHVLAVLDGVVHSFGNNAFHGDYGPTIILKHTFGEVEFYSLYGHLSLQSIPDLELGQYFKQGQIIGQLGDAGVNGDYAPHLHFQLILDIGNYFGDYPGVCNKNDLDYYMDNCPDPNLLLGLRF